MRLPKLAEVPRLTAGMRLVLHEVLAFQLKHPHEGMPLLDLLIPRAGENDELSAALDALFKRGYFTRNYAGHMQLTAAGLLGTDRGGEVLALVEQVLAYVRARLERERSAFDGATADELVQALGLRTDAIPLLVLTVFNFCLCSAWDYSRDTWWFNAPKKNDIVDILTKLRTARDVYNWVRTTKARRPPKAYWGARPEPVPRVEDDALSDGNAVLGEPPELVPYLDRFYEEFPEGTTTAFVMMSFAESPAHGSIVEAVVRILGEHGIRAVRADHREIADEVWTNIRAYMHGCTFGVAVFERILKQDPNPNVSLEAGYMMGLGKQVCFLKDKTLDTLQSDLVAKLYKSFDPQNVEPTLRKPLEKWLRDKKFIAAKPHQSA